MNDKETGGASDGLLRRTDLEDFRKSQEKAEEVLEKYEKESNTRKLHGKLGAAVAALAVAFSLFHLYTLGFAPLETLKMRTVHITGIVALIFLLFPARKGISPRERPSVPDWILFGAALAVGVYTYCSIDVIALRGGSYITSDVVAATVLVCLVLEASRRSVGNTLVVLALVFIVYALWGRHLSGVLRHSGFTLKRVATHLYLSSEGLMGITTGVSANYVFLFCLFGAFLAKSGMSDFFNDFAISLAGGSPGGPAKVSVLTSGMMGMVSGSAASNVATTGAFTIPLMKKLGYPAYYAGAVEAVASTAGQITPPVMGAGAFLMAEFLGISYSTIALAAILPAFLYYLCTWISVDLRARKLGMRGLPESELPDIRAVLIRRGYLMVPILYIIVMLCLDYTPTYAVVRAIGLTVLISWIRKDTRMYPRDILAALRDGAIGSLGVCVSCIVVCIVVGVTALTGLGTRLGMAILSLSQGNMQLTLILTMVVTIILGMGLPTSAAYIITATIAAPTLVRIGVDPLGAHFFVFYFAMLAGITPPVAVTAYIGAAIADADATRTAIAAVKLALAGFIIPYMFVYSPLLLLRGGSAFHIVLAAVSAIVGVYALASAVEGYLLHNLALWERALLFAAAIVLIKPGIFSDAAGLALLALVFAYRKIAGKRLKNV